MYITYVYQGRYVYCIYYNIMNNSSIVFVVIAFIKMFSLLVGDLQPFDVLCTKYSLYSGNTCMRTGDGYRVTLESVAGDGQSYYMHSPSGDKVKMPCPPWTTFNIDECVCALGGKIKSKPRFTDF